MSIVYYIKSVHLLSTVLPKRYLYS